MAKGKDIPYAKIAGGLFVLYGGYLVLKQTGLLPEKTKKADCNLKGLSSWEMSDGSTLDFVPKDFVKKLNACYRGTNLGMNPCNHLLRLIAENMTKNDLKCMYNSWSKNVSETESVTEFLSWQSPWEFAVTEKIWLVGAIAALKTNGLV